MGMRVVQIVSIEMVDFEIFNDDQEIELDKRFYAPVRIKSECPKCGETVIKDLSDNYLSYPTTNEPFAYHMDHHNEELEEDHEWKIGPVVLRIYLEKVQ